MNSKGFTLVEMLITIAVFGLILGIAIPSYTGISKSINNRHRNNLIKRIEIAASKYAADTGKTLFFVNELVTEGYIDSDDNGFVIDPVSKEKINCHKIEAVKEGNYYEASYYGDISYGQNAECNNDDLNNNNNTDIYISVSENGDIITLTAYGNVDIRCGTEDYYCYWRNTNGLEEITNSNIYSINSENKIINTTYIFEYIYVDENNENKSIVAKKEIKIDNKN